MAVIGKLHLVKQASPGRQGDSAAEPRPAPAPERGDWAQTDACLVIAEHLRLAVLATLDCRWDDWQRHMTAARELQRTVERWDGIEVRA